MIVTAPDAIERWTRTGWWGRTTVYDLFQRCVRGAGARLALVDPPNRIAFTAGRPQELSFIEVAAAVDRLAATLLAAGVRKDSIVVIQLPNIVEIVVAFLACTRIGAILSPATLAYRERDLRRIVAHLRPAAFLTLASFKNERPSQVAADVLRSLPGVETALLAFGEETDTRARSLGELGDLPASERLLSAYLATLAVDANEVVTMHWTSGTTGDPKCVPRTHNEWHATGGCCFDAGGLERGERILAPMQMAHTAGMGGLVMTWLEAEGTLFLHQPFDLPLFLDQLEERRINHTVAAPAMLNAILKSGALDGRDVSAMRSILCGSAPLDAWMIAGFRDRHGIEIVNAFGSTEGLTLLSGARTTGDPQRRARYFPRLGPGRDWGVRIGPVFETKLVDPTTGRMIDTPRTPGELLYRSPAVFPGYWTASGQIDRRDFDAEGFLRSGEIFEIAGEGEDALFYHYIDRLKDVINRGGVKIPVGELEAAIQGHPQVAEAVAIGYPDARLGERICAVVALMPDATLTLEELNAALAVQGIARFMQPERLEIVTALPRNTVGKVLKRDLASALHARNAAEA